MLKKLKAAATLVTLLAVLFTGAMLITAGPVRADHCSSKEESKKCDKDKKEEKSCDKEGDTEEAEPEAAEPESKDEDKGCDKDKGSEEKSDDSDE